MRTAMYPVTLMAIRPQIRDEILVRAEVEENSKLAGHEGKRGPDNSLEKAFLRCFPVRTHPEYLMIYQGAKMMGLIF